LFTLISTETAGESPKQSAAGDVLGNGGLPELPGRLRSIALPNLWRQTTLSEQRKCASRALDGFEPERLNRFISNVRDGFIY